jgi:hypothetical protein
MNSLRQNLSRLCSLSAELEKNKAERKVKADTKKNRQAILEACHANNLDELRRLIDLGVPLDFAQEADQASYGRRTLLGMAAHQDWTGGIVALLEAGASEANIAGYLENPRNESALVLAARSSKSAAFAALFGAYAPEEQKKAIATIHHPALLVAVEAHGMLDSLTSEKRNQLLASCVPHLDPALASDPLSAPACAAFDMLAKLTNLLAPSSAQARENLWCRALLAGAGAGALQGLAQRGVEPPEDAKVEITPAKHLPFHACLPHWIDSKPDPCAWDPTRVRHVYSPAAQEPLRVGLATLALARSGGSKSSTAYALCSIDALRDELVGSDLGRKALAGCQEPAIHRRLASLGADLSTFRDENGSTPLHRAVASRDTKANIESLARACTSWLGARDGQGKMPVELLKGSRLEEMAVVFDQIGVRDGLKGRLGKRPTQQTQRRL